MRLFILMCGLLFSSLPAWSYEPGEREFTEGVYILEIVIDENPEDGKVYRVISSQMETLESGESFCYVWLKEMPSEAAINYPRELAEQSPLDRQIIIFPPNSEEPMAFGVFWDTYTCPNYDDLREP